MYMKMRAHGSNLMAIVEARKSIWRECIWDEEMRAAHDKAFVDNEITANGPELKKAGQCVLWNLTEATVCIKLCR